MWLDIEKDRESAILAVLDKIVDEDTEVVTVYAGEDVDEDEFSAMLEKAEERFPDCDITSYRGNQPIYYYIASAE